MTRKMIKRDQAKIKKDRGVVVPGYKAFSNDLYQKYDRKAVISVLHHLEQNDIWACPNEDQYGPDLVMWEGFNPMGYIELAMRSAWKSGPWPRSFDPIRIEERKLKNFALQLPCDYWIICGDSSSAVVVPSGTIDEFKGSLHEVPNAKVSEGERFIQVPLDRCILKALS